MPIPPEFNATKILTYGLAGDDYEQWDKKRVDEILKLIKTIEAYSKQDVKYVDLRNPKDVYVQIWRYYATFRRNKRVNLQ